ncbi:hypothetical protein MTP99_000320 [Tenebrio molitor]|jgi:hypothetical protein|nr:hypothetical protein MTP99_000320 [Tenebrio molitor]
MTSEVYKRDKDTDNQERRERIKESNSMKHDRGNSRGPGERECKKEKHDGEIQMWQRGERKQWMEGKERRCRMCYEKRETIEHMWNGCCEMREREGKERGEILNEDGREIGKKEKGGG